MDGVADMQHRIAQISAQLAALSANANRPIPSTSATSSGSPGATGGSTSGAASGSFGSALSDAMSARTSGLGSGFAPAGGTAADAGGAGGGTGDPAAGNAGAGNPLLSTVTASTVTASTLSTHPLTPTALMPTALIPTAPNTATSAATSAYGAAPTAPAAAPRASAPDLSSYGNGRIPPALLEPIGVGDHRLAAPAADGFRSLLAAARRDGVRIGVNDSYRSYDQQVDMARRKGLYSQGGLAAKPGTSDHGLGRSVDLQLDSRALRWMRAHADEYGFSANVPRESWHWTFRAGR